MMTWSPTGCGLRRALVLCWFAGICSGCDTRYNAVTDGDYLCAATVVSSSCGPALPDSESIVFVTGGGSLTTDPLSLPSPLSPNALSGSGVQFGPQDDGFTYSIEGGASCGGMHELYANDLLAVLVDFGETEFSFRYIEDFARLSECAFADVTVDACRAERTIVCVLIS